MAAKSLELAITAIRSGRTDEGRQLLNLLIQQNPNDEMAWLWMSSVVNNDEQRARCLYHVLAINPRNKLAQRGLRALGIVVTDSRPVKPVRDSQPIHIPKPSPSDSKPLAPGERRPFRIDPQTLMEELPFTPVTEPFSQSEEAADDTERQNGKAASPKKGSPKPQKESQAPQESSQEEKKGLIEKLTAKLSLSANTEKEKDLKSTVKKKRRKKSSQQSQPAVAAQAKKKAKKAVPAKAEEKEEEKNPASEPVPAVASQHSQQSASTPQQPSEAEENASSQQLYPGRTPLQDTRPTQPIPTPEQYQSRPGLHGQTTMGMPIQQQQQPSQQPAQQMAQSHHSNPTMGMPINQQHPSAPSEPIHSNTTMRMPVYNNNQMGGGYGMQQPSEPMPSIHSSGTVGMAPYNNTSQNPNLSQWGNVQSGMQMIPYNMSANNSSVATYQNNQMGMVDYRQAFAASKANSKKKNSAKEDNDDEDEVNVLAVIIFGSLSVTALGGIGMLILLFFATG